MRKIHNPTYKTLIFWLAYAGLSGHFQPTRTFWGCRKSHLSFSLQSHIWPKTFGVCGLVNSMCVRSSHVHRYMARLCHEFIICYLCCARVQRPSPNKACPLPWGRGPSIFGQANEIFLWKNLISQNLRVCFWQKLFSHASPTKQLPDRTFDFLMAGIWYSRLCMW